MPRTTGARDARYDERRRDLLERMRARLGAWGAGHASLRELATAAGVSLSTLSHYFGRRDDVIQAIMEDEHERGQTYLAAMRRPDGPFAEATMTAASMLVGGLVYGGLSERYATNLSESLRHPELGPVFLSTWLEPTIEAVETRFSAHVAAGEMAGDPRAAALAFISPLLVAALHQRELGGHETRPLDMHAFAAAHAEAFIRGWSAPPSAARSGRPTKLSVPAWPAIGSWSGAGREGVPSTPSPRRIEPTGEER